VHDGRGFAITRFTNIRRTLSVTFLVNVVLCFPLQQATGQLQPEAGVASADASGTGRLQRHGDRRDYRLRFAISDTVVGHSHGVAVRPSRRQTRHHC